jgi:hypothetical protein
MYRNERYRGGSRYASHIGKWRSENRAVQESCFFTPFCVKLAGISFSKGGDKKGACLLSRHPCLLIILGQR